MSGFPRGQLDGPEKVESLAFPGSLLRALRPELGRREGSRANTLLALLIREGGSTSEHRDGLCAVVPVSHDYLGATASDLGSAGERANCRAFNEHWCQDGKVQLIACTSLKGKISDTKVIEDFESRPHKAVTFVVERERKGRNGVSKNCRRRYLDVVEEDYQEEAQKRQVGKKERKTREVEKGKLETISSEK